jgi:hypothetical protein
VKTKVVSACICVVLIAGYAARAEEPYRYHFGVKYWNVSNEFADGDFALGGVVLGYNISKAFWISAMLTTGGCWHDDGRTGTSRGKSQESDMEFVLGRSFRWFDIGGGLRSIDFSQKISGETSEVRSTGPMFYVGTGNHFGSSDVGWYGGASIVPVSFESDVDGDHYNLEGASSMPLEDGSSPLGIA